MSKRNYQSRAFLLAQHEADLARIAGLEVQIKTQAATIRSLKNEVDMIGVRERTVVMSESRSIMERAKLLAKQGTACYVRGGNIYASRTHEVIE